MDHCAQIATHVMFVLVLNLTVRLRVCRMTFAAIRGSVMRNIDSVASRIRIWVLVCSRPVSLYGSRVQWDMHPTTVLRAQAVLNPDTPNQAKAGPMYFAVRRHRPRPGTQKPRVDAGRALASSGWGRHSRSKDDSAQLTTRSEYRLLELTFRPIFMASRLVPDGARVKVRYHCEILQLG